MSEYKPRLKEKRWLAEMEEELIEAWEREGLYKPSYDPGDPRPVLAVDTPPPYASGKWHVGGAAHYAQIDMIARYFRLKGYNVIAPFYADRNGLPVEVQVEKAYNVYAHEMAATPEGREEFLALCREFLDRAEKDIVSVWRRMGCSFDYWREGTDSPAYRAMTQASFIELYRRGLIYEDFRPVRWCPRCRTTLAEAEVEHREEEGYLYYVAYELKDGGGSLVVATTRPELLAGCAALAYNPSDERYRGLKGRKAVAPIYGHEVEIVEHPAVDPHYGTGLMMICSFGDETDVRLFNELGLKPKWLINPDGTMRPEAGPLAGLSVEEARRRIVEVLEAQGLLVKRERVTHKVPVCWRCKTPLQIVYRREYFLNQLGFKEEVKRIASEIDFKPEMHRVKLYDWVDGIAMDWPISRDRYYATEIPVWVCRRCGSKLLPEPGKYYQPWKMEPPWEKCPHCGAPREYLEGEKRVFDTWFDSSLSVLYVAGWTRNKRYYERAIENALRPQGEDIIRTWLYYSLLRVLQLTGRRAFRWVRITGMGLDPKGRPMHKSLGNVIDPDPVINEYGADAFRFWAAIAARLGYDYRFDENKIKTGRNFATKLWNLARFVSAFPDPDEFELHLVDEAFIALQDQYLEEADEAYMGLDVYEPITRLYEFAWDVYASHYVELVKARAYNGEASYAVEEQRSAWASLHTMFRRLLIALSPIMPFVTDYAFRRLYGASVHLQGYPEPVYSGEERRRLAGIALKIIELDKAVWGYKAERGVRLVDPVGDAVLYIPEDLSAAARDLESMHKMRVEVYAGSPPSGAKPIGVGFYIVEDK